MNEQTLWTLSERTISVMYARDGKIYSLQSVQHMNVNNYGGFRDRIWYKNFGWNSEFSLKRTVWLVSRKYWKSEINSIESIVNDTFYVGTFELFFRHFYNTKHLYKNGFI